MKQKIRISEAEVYKCIHCDGAASIIVSKHTKKGTWPEIEFCPFCGMSNMSLAIFKNKAHKTLAQEK
jgi:hypothetical protein